MSAQREPGSSATVSEGSNVRSHHASRLAPDPVTPQGSPPPTFTDPDLLASGGIQIKALHITELRTAINALRGRLGLSAYSWQTSAISGGLIKADPILEMRTALDQALGAPSPAYAAGLAQGQPIKAIHIQELRDRVVAAWSASSAIPRDGLASVSYDVTSNRITTAGFDYDKAGNQVRALAAGSGSQRFQYDAANRLVKVKADDNATVLATYTYGDSNERLIADEGGLRTYYACGASMEYVESGSSTTPQWSKTYIYLGARLLSTLTPNPGTPNTELTQYHHPDRLGTRLVTNAQDTTYFEQVTLPFGTALNAESTGSTNRRFTSYDRSSATGLDYAVNRHYDPQQGRFTQVDPAGMRAASLASPQSLNLYSYCGNDPINRIDRDGLGILSFIAKLYRAVKKILKWVAIVVAVAFVVVLAFAVFNLPGAQFLADIFFKGLGLLLKYMVKAGIMHFAEAGGGLTVGLTGQIVGAAMTVGAIANQQRKQQRKKKEKDERPSKVPNLIIVREKSPEAVYKRCVDHEWEVFNQDVEKINQAAEDKTSWMDFWMRLGDYLFRSGSRPDPSEPGENLPKDPGESIDPGVGPAAARAIQKRKEIEEATQKAAENREKAIKNCKKPT